MNKSMIDEAFYENDSNNNYPDFRVHLPKNRRWQYTSYGSYLKNEAKLFHQNNKTEINEECSSMNDNKNSNNHFQFKIASYNILAPSLLSQNFYLYRDINQSYTDWNYRKLKIYREIKQFNADVYCFQEMQEDQYLEYFLPRFKQLGYKCYFMKRQGEKPDGCCIIFKARKFRLINLEYINFFVSSVPVLNRENVGIIMLLEPKCDSGESKRICVATTHILYNPKRGDCKLAQIQYFLSHIDAMAFDCIKNDHDKLVHIYHPIILCGDFNCDFRSKFYEFIQSGKLSDYKNINRNLFSGQLDSSSSYIPIENNLISLGENLNISDACQFKHKVLNRINCLDSANTIGFNQPNLNHGGLELSHSFNFESAYKHYNDDMSLEITTCLRDTKKTVDYIFFHNNNENATENQQSIQLKLLATLELFKMNQVEHVLSLPIKNYPSDHFMIAAKFALN